MTRSFCLTRARWASSLSRASPWFCPARTLVREDYAHLHVRRTLLSLAYVPMIVNETLIGALEAATFDEALNEAELAGLVELVDYAAPAFSSATHYETERNSHLESISRLTQLYDVEKVFNSTLEMDELNPSSPPRCENSSKLRR